MEVDLKKTDNVIHSLDYPPRGTACGLYYPKGLLEKGFGSYSEKDVTCKNCLRVLQKQENTRQSLGLL